MGVFGGLYHYEVFGSEPKQLYDRNTFNELLNEGNEGDTSVNYYAEPSSPTDFCVGEKTCLGEKEFNKQMNAANAPMEKANADDARTTLYKRAGTTGAAAGITTAAGTAGAHYLFGKGSAGLVGAKGADGASGKTINVNADGAHTGDNAKTGKNVNTGNSSNADVDDEEATNLLNSDIVNQDQSTQNTNTETTNNPDGTDRPTGFPAWGWALILVGIAAVVGVVVYCIFFTSGSDGDLEAGY